MHCDAAGGTSGPVARRTASRVFNLAIRGALGLPFGDTQSGLKGFRRPAAQQIFRQARVDGFAFDVEVLWLARQLRLEVAEVGVQAMERQGSKVQVVADALAMLGEVWTVRRARTTRAHAEVGSAPNPIPGGRGQRSRLAAWGGDHPGRRAGRLPGRLITAETISAGPRRTGRVI